MSEFTLVEYSREEYENDLKKEIKENGLSKSIGARLDNINGLTMNMSYLQHRSIQEQLCEIEDLLKLRNKANPPKDVKFTIDDCSGCTVGDRAKLMNKFQWRDYCKGDLPTKYQIILITTEKGNQPFIGGWQDISKTNRYWKPIYDESVPCCGLSEDEWNEVMGKCMQ